MDKDLFKIIAELDSISSSISALRMWLNDDVVMPPGSPSSQVIGTAFFALESHIDRVVENIGEIDLRYDLIERKNVENEEKIRRAV